MAPTNKAKKPTKRRKTLLTRRRYNIEIKLQAIHMHQTGKSNKQIIQYLKEKWNIEVSSSTVSTWYHPEAIEKLKRLPGSSVVHKEYRINNKQRPMIVVEMEHFLCVYIDRQNESGLSITKRCLQEQARCLFNKLKESGIYAPDGSRYESLKNLSASVIEAQLTGYADDIVAIPCTVCEVRFKDANALIQHLTSEHVEPKNTTSTTSTTTTTTTTGDAAGATYRFEASNGWLSKFMNRANVHNVSMQGEKGSSDYPAAERFRNDLIQHLLECKYLPKAVLKILLNIDKCGLQWKTLPKRTYKRKDTIIKAKKSIKDRLTIMVGTAMDGFKLKPLVIGKAMNPRALKGVERETLPVIYYHHDTAWMTKEILHHWFIFYFLDEIKERYGTDVKIILMLDNAGSHPNDLGDGYKHLVNVMYLPANTTPLIQPMDQGIIYMLKYNYMRLYYERLLKYVMIHHTVEDPLVPFVKTYTIKDALMDIGTAWEKIDEQLCHKCYENVLDTDNFMKLYNEQHNTAMSWPGASFRGFKQDDEINLKAQFLSDLLKGQDVYSFASEDIKETIVYDPNTSVSVNDCIEEGFSQLRIEAGIQDSDEDGDASDDEDAVEVRRAKALNESYKALLNFCITPGIRYMTVTDKRAVTNLQEQLRLKFLKYIEIDKSQASTSTTTAPPREDNSDASLPSLNPSLNNSHASLSNSYASLDDIHYDNTIVLLDDAAAYDADSSIDITTITEADRGDAVRDVITPPAQPKEADRGDAARDVITPPAQPKSPSSRSLTQSPMHTETAAVGDAEAAPVTHFRARPVRYCRSREWEGRYADNHSSDELHESSQESLYIPVVDKTEDSD